jgi:hypothetical protein
MKRETDRVKRDRNHWRSTASDLQSQLSDTVAEVRERVVACSKADADISGGGHAKRNTQDGWRRRFGGCPNGTWKVRGKWKGEEEGGFYGE